jgi:hypothetical protein
MVKSQKNIDFLNKNTVVYHTRAERSAYLAVVVNRNFVSSTTAAQAIFEFITGDQLETQLLSEDAASAARYALNCQDSDIIVDMRKLNARPKHNTFDQFGAKMAEMV